MTQYEITVLSALFYMYSYKEESTPLFHRDVDTGLQCLLTNMRGHKSCMSYLINVLFRLIKINVYLHKNDIGLHNKVKNIT